MGALYVIGSDTLEVITAQAVTVDMIAYYADNNAGTISFGRNAAQVSTAVTTVLVAAPGGSIVRQVKYVNLRNRHASLTVDVTVQHDIAAVNTELTKYALKPGEQLEFIPEMGWYKLPADATSRRKLLGGDHINSTVTPTEATGLSLVTGLGTFKFQYLLRYQTAALTTGIRVSANHAGTVAFFVYNMQYVDTAATASTGAPDQDALAATAQVVGGYAARVKSTAGTMVTASVDTANADMLAIVDGLFECTADGEIELWWGSEIAASAATLKTGSALLLEKIV